MGDASPNKKGKRERKKKDKYFFLIISLMHRQGDASPCTANPN